MSEIKTAQQYMDEGADLIRKSKAIYETADQPAEKYEEADKLFSEGKQLQERGFKLTEIGKSAAAMLDAKETKENKTAKPRRRRHIFTPVGSDFQGEESWEDFMDAMFDAWATKGQEIDPRLLPMKRALRDPEEQKSEEEYFKAEYKGRKDLGESVGASGGFLVPSAFYNQLQAVQGETGIVRPRATAIRIQRRSVGIPVLDQTGTTAGIPHWYGGMKFYWAEEGASKTETDAAFRKVYLTAHKLIGYTEASDELVDDSAISLGDFFNSSLGFVGGIAWMEDYAFLRGTGAGQPLGVLNAGATISVPRTGTTTPIIYADLVNMLESFLPGARGVWVANQSTMSNLMTMQHPSGQYVWQPNLQAGVPPTLMGYPIIFTEKTPTVGNAGDLLLADFRYYLLGDRQATTVESTQFYRWQYDITSWRAVHRVDGQPWLSAPLTLSDGTLQVSPFVQLAAKTT